MTDAPSRKVVTRFAPSPTGFLHIGGARTALFNWAFARQQGGTFVLRIEDTDAARSSDASLRGILADLRWLGLNWDEGPAVPEDWRDAFNPAFQPAAAQVGRFGPYFQSQRGELYRQYLDRLVAAGRAYRCFKSPEQLKAERDAQKAAGAPMKYNPAEALGRSESEQRRLIGQGVPFVWRFRMPDRAITVADRVLGDVTIAAEELEDFVILKSEAAGGGGPTFHFANVVDDATMAVTHVLRAQEHLMNTPKHVALFEALGLAPPVYAHMPLIFNPDGTKMSKRDKAKVARQAAKDFLKKPGNDPAAFLAAVIAESRRVADLSNPPSPVPSAAELQAFLDKKNDDARIAEVVAHHLRIPLPEIEVADFRASGYLKDVLLNYVSLLGWSPEGKDQAGGERFDLDYIRDQFRIERLGRTNARFDRAKLLAFNGEALQAMTPPAFAAALWNYWEEPGQRRARDFFADPSSPAARDQDRRPKPVFALFAEAYRPRSRTLADPARLGEFFLVADEALVYDAKAVAKVLDARPDPAKPSGRDVLRDLRTHLAGVPEEQWNPAGLHACLERVAADSGRPVGDLAQPLRVAVSGSTVSPAIHDTLAILGKTSTLARLARCLAG